MYLGPKDKVPWVLQPSSDAQTQERRNNENKKQSKQRC
jgi:hypothetical protein